MGRDDEASGQLSESIMLRHVAKPLRRDVSDALWAAAVGGATPLPEARPMADRVAGARGGEVHDVEVASPHPSLELVAEPTTKHVVPRATVLGVEGCDVEAALAKASSEVEVMALAREDDEGGGPRPGPPKGGAPSRPIGLDGGEGWLTGVRRGGFLAKESEVTLDLSLISGLMPLLDTPAGGLGVRRKG